MTQIDIEDDDQLIAYLIHRGQVTPDEQIQIAHLSGGVSNKTVWVGRESGEAWVIKQALPKLRVQTDWFSDPKRIHREALGLTWLKRYTPPDTVPGLIFEDQASSILAMAAVPQPHDNWKPLLLAGEVDFDLVQQFAEILGGIHRGTYEARVETETVFADQSFFESLRLEPYYQYTAAKHPSLEGFYKDLIMASRAHRVTIVHGDYSPKNILVYQNRLVLLDYEVIHFGDPAFDIGFSLTHLLSKAHHVAQERVAFADAARFYWQVYSETVGSVPWLTDFEPRAVRHTLACLLARVDGRSPLEYLSEEERDRQRAVVINLIAHPPLDTFDLIASFVERL